MVSIKDVARHAGVAVSTVSKVINNYPNVSDRTKKKVNASIDELGFVPNAIASALSSKQSNRIALIMDPNTQTNAIDEIQMQYISGALARAMEKKVDVVTIFFSMISDKDPVEIERYLQSIGIKAIIIYGLSKDDETLNALIERQAFKMVIVDAPFVNENTSSIWIDQEEAQYEVAKRTLLENGGGRILYISGRRNAYVTVGRLKGVRRLAEERDLTLQIKDGEFSELEARKIVFDCAENSDIIVCASDLMAIGAMKALEHLGISRPVCGFDGIALMAYVGLQMNTVRQDFYRISQMAMDEAIRLMVGKSGRNIVLDYSIINIKYEELII